jgi:DNA-binding transcriptional MerR regulator
VTTPLTIGVVADRLGVTTWQVRRLFERGLLPPAARVGPYRVIDPADLQKVEAALRAAGYIREKEAAPCA